VSDQNMEDPFAVTVDEGDPFATAEDFKSGGGSWNPRPSSAEALAENLIVIVPREFDPEAEVSKYMQEKFNMKPTREQWTADIVVLRTADGGPWTFNYRGKKDRDSEEYVEKSHTVEEFPYLMPGFRVTWGNVMGAIRKIHEGPRPMGVGRIRAGYTAKEMRAGKTFEDFVKETEAWEARVKADPKKAGAAPVPRWHFEPFDAAGRPADQVKADKDLALAWWNAARAAGFTI
jgi:hypothetical protein